MHVRHFRKVIIPRQGMNVTELDLSDRHTGCYEYRRQAKEERAKQKKSGLGEAGRAGAGGHMGGGERVRYIQ
jgi:hypothetical protein